MGTFTLIPLLFLAGALEENDAHIFVHCVQETIYFGDTLYIEIGVENNGTDSLFVSDVIEPIEGSVQLTLTDKAGNTIPLLFELPSDIFYSPVRFFAEISPNGSRVTNHLSITIPALEDIHHPFWEEQFVDIPSEGKEFLLQISVVIPITAKASISKSEKTFFANKFFAKNGWNEIKYTYEHHVIIKPRCKNEMILVDQWYQKTPPEFFPVTDDTRRPTRKIPQIEYGILTGRQPSSKSLFIQFGNRYPGDPNGPETWQGWKELEESLVPSTMRDEIRMTRIVIQYCDTEDSKVLEELTEWLKNMNEIQRVVMIKNVINLSDNFPQDSKVCKPLNKLIETIRPFVDTNTESIQ